MIALHGVCRVAHLGKAVNGNVIDVLGVHRALADHCVADGAGDGLQFPFPLAFEPVQFVQYVRLGEAVGTRHPPIGEIQSVQFIKEAEDGFLAVGDWHDDTHVLPTDLRFKSAVKRRIIEIFVDEEAISRIFERSVVVRDGGMQIGEQSVLVQKVHGDPQSLEHIVELFDLLGKEGKDVLRLGHLLLAPFNDEFFDLLLPVFGRQEVQCSVEGGFVVDSRGEQLAAFGIHAARHGIGEIIRRRVCGRWRALRFKVEDIVGFESCECLMEAVRNDRQFLLHGGVKIRTPILPRRL